MPPTRTSRDHIQANSIPVTRGAKKRTIEKRKRMVQHWVTSALNNATTLSNAPKVFSSAESTNRMTIILNDDKKTLSHARYVLQNKDFVRIRPHLHEISRFGRQTTRKDGIELICLWAGVQDGIEDIHYNKSITNSDVSVKQATLDGEFFNIQSHVKSSLAEAILGIRSVIVDLQSITEVFMGSEATESTKLVHEILSKHGEMLFPGFSACFATSARCFRGTSFHLDLSNHPYSVGVLIPIYTGKPTPRGVKPMLYLPKSDTWINLEENEVAFIPFQETEHVVKLFPPDIAEQLTPEEQESCWQERTSLILTDSLRTSNYVVRRDPAKFAKYAKVVKRTTGDQIEWIVKHKISLFANNS